MVRRIYCVTLLLLLVALLVGIAAGCSSPLDRDENTALVSSKVTVIEGDSLAALASVSDADGAYTFTTDGDGLPAALAGLEAGAVIVGSPGEAAPNGFLRKVESVSNDGSNIVVVTSRASLADVFEECHFSTTKALSPADVQEATPLIEGITLDQAGSGGMSKAVMQATFTVGIKDAVIFRQSSSGRTITASGTVAITPSFDLKIDFDLRGCTYFKFTNTTVIKGDLSINTDLVDIGFDKKISVAHYTFVPITIPIAGIPVVITPVLEAVIGANGSVSASVGVGCSFNANVTVGLEKSNGSIHPIASKAFSATGFEPSIEASASLKGYFGPQLDLLIYGVVGPYVLFSDFLEAEVTFIPELKLTVSAGVQVDLGIKKSDLLTLVTGGESEISFPSIIEFKVPIIERTFTPTPTPVPTSAPTSASTAVGTTVPTAPPEPTSVGTTVPTAPPGPTSVITTAPTAPPIPTSVVTTPPSCPPADKAPLKLSGNMGGIVPGLVITHCIDGGMQRKWIVSENTSLACFVGIVPQEGYCGPEYGGAGHIPHLWIHTGPENRVAAGTWITWCTGYAPGEQYVWKTDDTGFVAIFQYSEYNADCP